MTEFRFEPETIETLRKMKAPPLDFRFPVLAESTREYAEGCRPEALFLAKELGDDSCSLTERIISARLEGKITHEESSNAIDDVSNIVDKAISSAQNKLAKCMR